MCLVGPDKEKNCTGHDRKPEASFIPILLPAIVGKTQTKPEHLVS